MARAAHRGGYRYLSAGGISVAVDGADVDVSLAVAEHQVATLSVEDELKSVERPPGVRAVPATRWTHPWRYVHDYSVYHADSRVAVSLADRMTLRKE